MSQQARTRTGEVLRGVGAFAVLVFLLAVVPVGLYLVGGSPIPRSLPTWAQISQRFVQPDTDNAVFLGAVKLIGWVSWSLFVAATAAEGIGYLADRPVPRLPRPIQPMQYLARDLVAMVALIFSTTAPIAGATTTPLTYQPTVSTSDPTPSGQHAADAAATHVATTPPSGTADTPAATSDRPKRRLRVRIVKAGDTLWGLAQREYGAGKLYPKIFNASKQLRQPAALPRLTDPDRIYPGQRVGIPRHATGPQRGASGKPGRTAHRPSTASPAPAAPPTPPKRPLHSQPTGAPAPSAAPSPSASPAGEPASPPAATPQTPPPDPATGRGTSTRPGATQPSRAPSAAPPVRTAAEPESGHRGGPVAVSLPTGAYAGIGLAAAISIAVAATRLHQRRRHTPSEHGPTHPDPPPTVPRPVAALRKVHLDSYTTRGEPVPSDADLVAADLTTPAPTEITLGVRDGHHLTLPLAGMNLGLAGPSALEVARAVATELIAKAHRYRVELLIPEPDAAALFAGTGIDPSELARAVPELIVPASLSAAVAHLEAELIHRARLMETTDEQDVQGLRSAEPGEPLPAIVVLTTVPQLATDALNGILQRGRPYCVGGLLLGDWPAGSTAHIADDGTVTATGGPDTVDWTDGRLFHISAADAGGMLATIRAARGTPAPAGPTAADTCTSTTADTRPHPGPASNQPDPASPDPQAGSASGQRPVQLYLLGTYCLRAGGQPIATGLRRIARDLLAYLALNPDGVTREQGVDALCPDRDLDTGTTMFHTAINNARRTLRAATGLREPMFVTHTQGRYRLDPHLFDVDLWRLHDALTSAHHAPTDPDRIHALTPIPDLYTGDLATDLTHEWAETHREQLRRYAIDALAHLAQLTQEDHPEQALRTLEQAIAYDPYAEPLYQTLMRLQARLDRPDAARRTYQLLKNRLADLDAEPTQQSHQLLQTLLHRPSPRPTPQSGNPPTEESQ